MRSASVADRAADASLRQQPHDRFEGHAVHEKVQGQAGSGRFGTYAGSQSEGGHPYQLRIQTAYDRGTTRA